ncbi:MAG: hypothetical protein JWR34_145 [Mycobacterium sp.]|nr:hypothetical protein [Mycobacterium sp.]
MGRNAVSSNELFIDDLRVPVQDRVGEEGKGFAYLLDGLNPERMLIAAEALGIGRVALDRAENYANAADRAMQTLGGMGYSEEYAISRFFREARLMKIAPISQEMILNFLGLPCAGFAEELLTAIDGDQTANSGPPTAG